MSTYDIFHELNNTRAERDAAIARAEMAEAELRAPTLAWATGLCSAHQVPAPDCRVCNRALSDAVARAEAAEARRQWGPCCAGDFSDGMVRHSPLCAVGAVFDQCADLRAKLAAAEAAHKDTSHLMVKQALGLQERRRRIEIAEADNAALVGVLKLAHQTIALLIIAGCTSDSDMDDTMPPLRSALASPHPGAALLEAVRLVVKTWDEADAPGHPQDPWAHDDAIDALRPWAGKPT